MLGYVSTNYQRLVNRYSYSGNLLWSWKGGETNFAGASNFFLQKVEGRSEYLYAQTVPKLGGGTFDAWTQVWIIGNSGDTVAQYYYGGLYIEIQSFWANADYFLFSAGCNLWEQELQLPTISSKFRVYPNPSAGFIIIEPPIDLIPNYYSYRIYNQNGSLVRRKNRQTGQAYIQLDSQQAGQYLLKIEDSKGIVYHEKFIKI
jgi:hypothetical protein